MDNEVKIRVAGDISPYRAALNSIVSESKKASVQVGGVGLTTGNVFRQMGEQIRGHVGQMASGVTGMVSRARAAFGLLAQSARAAFLNLRSELAATVDSYLNRIPVIGRALSGFGVGGGRGGGPPVPAVPAGAFGGISAGTAIFAGLTAAASAAAAMIGNKLARDVANANERFQDMARIVNISAEGLSALEHVAAMQGASIHEMESALIRLNDRMQDAASGDKRAAGLFKQFGIEVKESEGRVRPVLHVLLDLADSLEAMGDTSKRTSLLMDMFGTQVGAKLLRVLKDGSGDIRKLLQEAYELNTVLSTESQQAAERYNQAIRGLSEQWRGLKMTIATAVLPTFATLFENLNEFFSWLHGQVTGSTGQAVLTFFKALGSVAIGRPADAGRMLTDMFRGAENLKGAASGAAGALDDLLGKERGSAIKANTTATKQWVDTIDQLRRSLTDQLRGIEEQKIALTHGALAAKDYAMTWQFLEDRQKAVKDGAPAAKLKEMDQIFYSMKPNILGAADAMDKLMGRDWATELKRRTNELGDSFLRVMDSVGDLTGLLNPGQQAFRNYERSVMDAERSIESLLITARREAKLGIVEGAAEKVQALEAALASIRAKLADPMQIRLDYDRNVIDELSASLKEDLEALQQELELSGAVTREDRARVEVNRLLSELKKSHVNDAALESEELRRQLLTHEGITQALKERLTFQESMKSRREDIEDTMLDIRGLAAITKEEKVQIEVERALLDLRRQNVEVTREQAEEAARTVTAQQAAADILKRLQQQIQDFENAIGGALDNMSSAFDGLVSDLFNPRKGENAWKTFLTSILQGWQQAFQTISKDLMGNILNDLFKGSGGTLKESITNWFRGLFNVGKLTPVDGEAPQQFDNSVLKFSTAVERFLTGVSGGAASGPGPAAAEAGSVYDDGLVDVMEMGDAVDEQLNNAATNFGSALLSNIPGVSPALSQALHGPGQGFLSLMLGGLMKVGSQFGTLLMGFINTGTQMLLNAMTGGSGSGFDWGSVIKGAIGVVGSYFGMSSGSSDVFTGGATGYEAGFYAKGGLITLPTKYPGTDIPLPSYHYGRDIKQGPEKNKDGEILMYGTPGEYVLPVPAVQRLGLPMLESMRLGDDDWMKQFSPSVNVLRADPLPAPIAYNHPAPAWASWNMPQAPQANIEPAPINLQVILRNPIDPATFGLSADQVVEVVNENYAGGGKIRTTIREDRQ
jgi:hypothetical protein